MIFQTPQFLRQVLKEIVSKHKIIYVIIKKELFTKGAAIEEFLYQFTPQGGRNNHPTKITIHAVVW